MALAVLSAAPATAHADGVPVVVIVSPSGTGLSEALFDREIPASTEFLLRYPMPKDTEVASGILDVWPWAERVRDSQNAQACGSPQPGALQTYSLGLVLASDADAKFLEARVPALQVGQRFCFRVRATQSMTTGELNAIARTAASLLAARVLGGKECYSASSLQEFKGALEDALASTASKEKKPNLNDVEKPAGLALNRYLETEARQCSAMTEAAARQLPTDMLTAALVRERKADSALKTLRRLPPLGSPLVKLSPTNQVVTVDTLLKKGASSEDIQNIKDAAAQLRSRRGRSASWDAVLDAWANLLTELSTVAPDKLDPAVAAARTAAAKLPAPPELELWNGQQFVPVAEFLDKGHVPEAEPLARGTITLLPASPLRTSWLKALDDLVNARKEAAQIQKDFAERQSVATQKRAEFETVIANAFKESDARKALLINLRPLVTPNTFVGGGQTPDYGNFASVDAGVLAAMPGFDLWVLPYLGLNVYFTPVDRKIAPSQLTGTPMEKLLQRASLTVGITLSKPTSPGLTVDAPLLDRFPLIALGCRIGQYTRIAGGMLLYTLHNPNPVSAQTTLRPAFFVGASLDADIVALLTSKKL